MGSPEFAPILEQALRRHDNSLVLRQERQDDLAFLIRVYTDGRWQELAAVPWTDQARSEFLADQCRLQHRHYAEHYAGAELLIIEQEQAALPPERANASEPIGRIYLHATPGELRLMEFALLGVHCGHGIGSAVIRALQAEALSRKLALTLHVEPGNPAQRLYARLGFSLIEHRGAHDFLGWNSPALAVSAQH